MKSRISGKEAVYVARESERRRPVKLLASDRVDGVSVEQRLRWHQLRRAEAIAALRAIGIQA